MTDALNGPYHSKIKEADRCASGLRYFIQVYKLEGGTHRRKFHGQLLLNYSIHPHVETLQRLGTLIMFKQTMMAARQSGCSVSS